MPTTKYLVEVVEHDSWSGPKIDETIEFTDKNEADKFVNSINSKNTLPYVPEYYLTASIVKTWTVK